MKKGILISVAIAFLGAVILWLLFAPPRIITNTGGELHVMFRSSNKKIQICENGRWEDFEIIGVNIGTGYPGLFPNEPGIDEDTYYRWLEKIAEMHANTIRVYRIQSPAFYNAFFRYNESHMDKLFLIQGVNFSDHLMYSEKNILDSGIKKALFDDTNKVIDALHGNRLTLDAKKGQLDAYFCDVSEYVLGYILGVEWDELFVEYICRMNQEDQGLPGEYLYYSEAANPFEMFLAEWGDNTLAYEQANYNTQKLISYCNWPDTDPLVNEFMLSENTDTAIIEDTEAIIDLEHICTTEKVKSGLFASYNVYPYFPYFLQCGEYTEYIDDSGNRNPYRKYLMELVDHHTYPVIISEYGVPASRSKAYDDIWHKIKHGGLTEQEQGEAILKLYKDIQKAGCAGSIVFSWQDEWYKTIWNEKCLSDPDGRAYWSDAQSAEASFGLLAFEPGVSGQTVYPDGNFAEWTEMDLIAHNGDIHVRMQSDEKYIYIMVEGLCKNSNQNLINIALDVTPKSGSHSFSHACFTQPVDFVIQIGPQHEGVLRVQEYYDTLIYSALGMYNTPNVDTISALFSESNYSENPTSDSTGFNVVSRASNNIINQLQFIWVRENVGRLKEGNANPNSPDYNSNADYFISDDTVEIRIPWQLLNFYDPSKCLIIDDFRANNYQIKGLKIDRIYAAAYYDDQTEVTQFGAYELKSWDTPKFHERLKQSYYILQEAFGREKAS